MTIDRRFALAIPIVLAGWLAVLAVVMRLSGAAPAAIVIWPPHGLIGALPPGASVTSVGPYSITVKGDAGLVAALYAAGAPLVLPAGLTGCLPQTAI
jgi:hypothetical protein